LIHRISIMRLAINNAHSLSVSGHVNFPLFFPPKPDDIKNSLYIRLPDEDCPAAEKVLVGVVSRFPFTSQ